ncbi:taurine ABC transporter substrate-binding protein [Acinetobacter sp. 194]|uniref:taurine ABC transporter substrate-binding protein n=1 Tax=Acinetobacter shaoyimingii TaxID=2715164 RepID=UPI00140723FE|nr:taurine ABC transporter substrate-binding protein [Acinetobacter shaoyimingii]NHB58505.1 taurine ABC transporter substrate-binding protein [Acinetobacter shaoyimingii]
MSSKNKKPIFIVIAVIAVIAIFIFFQKNKSLESNTQSKASNSNQKAVVIGYQTGVDPSKVAQAEGAYEKDSKQSIEWKKFDAGSDVVNALASGDVDIGNIGTSPLAAATSRDLPIEVFFIASKLGSSEALVVSNKSGIQKPEDLVGKTIAVPFVSTTHYSLLSALKHWKIAEDQVKIINLRPPEISAAWERGDIDATYVWEPVLGKAKATGKVLVDSTQVSEWGSPTYDVWVVRKDFAKKNPEFLKSFVNTSIKQIDAYNKDPKAFENNSENIAKIAQLTGSDAKDIPLLLAGNVYLDRQQQFEIFSKAFAKNIFDTASFLKEQGKVDKVKDDYQDNVSTLFVQP